jgi:hypothetical protein
MATAAIRDTPGQQPTQALSAPTGLPYGQRQELIQGQRVAPMAGGGGQLPAAPASPRQRWDGAMGALAGHMPPGVGPITEGSRRPNEPTTAGLSTGPGPGPEILQGAGATAKASSFFRTLYETTGDEALAALAERAAARGQ